MKKSELKNIIKECVREVIFEEGVLSSVVTEVAQGLSSVQVIQESPSVRQARTQPKTNSNVKQQVLDAVGKNSYDDLKSKFSNPELFEGTKPIIESKSQGGALSGVDPRDPGVDISQIPGFGKWSSVAMNK
tara:strand:- start:740 stop:1132 length:393 start_codon:yes stop_codon:yes gene_type:complete